MDSSRSQGRRGARPWAQDLVRRTGVDEEETSGEICRRNGKASTEPSSADFFSKQKVRLKRI